MITGIVGLPGSGKTYFLSKIGREAIKQGRKVYANYKLAGAYFYDDLDDVFTVKDGLILIDEINLLCPSRFYQKLPEYLAYYWSQSRKLGLDVIWTAQHIDRVEKIVREITSTVWKCIKFPANRNKAYGIIFAREYIPEHMNLESKKTALNYKFISVNKKIMSCYNTYEMIELSKHLKANFDKNKQVEFIKIPDIAD